MSSLERRERDEPGREERDQDTNMVWALGLSILALGAVLVPAGGPVFLLIGVLLAIGATVALVKDRDRLPNHRQATSLSAGEDRRSVPSPPVSKERELLSALRDRGGSITPVEAAIETSLTVREADKMLSELAGEGHLAVGSRDGILFYSLPGQGRRGLEGRG